MAKDGFSMSNRRRLETLDGNKTLTQDDCGKTFVLDASGGLTASLPGVARAMAGWNCEFIVITDATTQKSYKISAASGEYFNGAIGFLHNSNHTTGNIDTHYISPGATDDNCYLTGPENGGLAGSRINLVTDGNFWYIDGVCNQSGSPDYTNVFRTA